jgi:hypothetical protein
MYARYNGSIVTILDSTGMLDGKALVAGQDGINLGTGGYSGGRLG